MDGMDYISTSRVFCLLIGLLWAAYLDLKFRRVPNAFWVTWASPAIFLWTLELLVLETPNLISLKLGFCAFLAFDFVLWKA